MLYEVITCSKAGVAFVKTSTGFGFISDSSGNMKAMGATLHHIDLMRKNSAHTVSVKASGGIKSISDIEKLYALGATRFGTSSTVNILEGLNSNADY